MAYNITPLRQLERLYGSILRGATQLTRVSESSERQEQLARSSATEISASINSARDALLERVEASSAQLRQLNAAISQLTEQVRNQVPHNETQRYLADLRAQVMSETPGNPAIHGWRSFSQCDEDGIIRECLRRIGQATPLSHTFIEVGCADGIENNTHQLVLDGFTGCWLDGDSSKIRFIEEALGSHQTPKLMVRQAFVTLESIERVIKECRDFLNTDDIDFYSFDIDGNDLHLVRASLKLVKPKLVCVEYNAKFPPPTRLEMDYRSDHRWSGDDYYGASLQSWVDMLEGYKLVSCNLSGVNAFFVRRDLAHCFADHGVDSLYQTARYWLVGQGGGHRASLRWLKQSAHLQRIEGP
ncbi:hypothetical protein [Variovorax sp. YR216]|uniref:hypothetical protein n=1 Tax=Variovorax sp. YR216 TaxID=1882828 RepID=UPI0008985B38|nr:hypothetical protein [Variovorax sp. YR216]SEA73897.1 hypothetical protein SAMN05444680_103352 [Variovorax sp. YR216]